VEDLKMGDIVEIQESADRIFIKENKDGSIICVHDIFGIEFNSGNSFLTTRWEKHEWRRKQETNIYRSLLRIGSY